MKPELDPLNVALGAELRRRRTAARLSLADIGKAIGVTYQQVRKYETGENRLTIATGVRLAGALGCGVDALTAAIAPVAADARPARAPTARALKLAAKFDCLPAYQHDVVERIVEAIFDGSRHDEIEVIRRDGHPAIASAH